MAPSRFRISALPPQGSTIVDGFECGGAAFSDKMPKLAPEAASASTRRGSRQAAAGEGGYPEKFALLAASGQPDFAASSAAIGLELARIAARPPGLRNGGATLGIAGKMMERGPGQNIRKSRFGASSSLAASAACSMLAASNGMGLPFGLFFNAATRRAAIPLFARQPMAKNVSVG